MVIRRNPCKSAKTVPLDPACRIARLVRPWSLRRFRPKHQPGHSTSGWRPSSERTTFACDAHSSKKDLKDGTVQIEGILLDPPEYVSTAKVFDMLMAVPKFGRVKAARLLNQCRISQSKTVGGLSERQRAELVSLFNR